MSRYRIGVLPVIWIVVGVVVAAIYDYFEYCRTVMTTSSDAKPSTNVTIG